jgi:ATP-dependent Lhr-like helicase
MSTAEEALLHPRLLELARRYGYSRFNDLQLRAFKVLKRRANAVIVAPTGYGKTEAALFPVLSSILDRGEAGPGVRALYVTPLRALNRDIFQRMSRLAGDLGVSLEVRHGDTPQSVRKRIAENPPQILITTPETLQFILVNPKLREALRALEWVIVDELHELIPSKRGLQLSIALERLEEASKRNVCRVGLSATVRNPVAAGLFLAGGRYFEVIEASGGRQYEVEVVYTGTYDDAEERARLLAELAQKHESVLVFTNTRDTAEALGVRLRRLCGEAVAVHHGSLSREQRTEVEHMLKQGGLRCVIATSSLELGIDVGHVKYVVQYMSPRQVNRLVQRVGRSAHFLGGVARGCIVASDIDDLLESIVIARRARSGDLEDAEFEELAYDVLAHQLVGLVLERGEVSLEEAHIIVTRAYPYRNLKLGQLRSLAEFLAGIKLLRLREGKLLHGSRCIKYYFDAASTIPDTETFEVVDITARRKVGALDGDFAASSLSEGGRFVLGGRAWEVVKVDLEEGKVFVSPSDEHEAAIPAWIGEDLPVPFKVAREVGALRRRLICEPLSKLAGDYGVGEELLAAAREHVEKQLQAVGIVPSDRDVVVEVGNRLVVIHACLGTRANALLALLLSYALARAAGVSSKYFFDAYRVALSLSRDVGAKELKELLTEKLEKLLADVGSAVRSSSLYLWKMLQVCQRMGVVEKGSRLKLPVRKLAELFEGTPLDDEVIKELLSTRLDLNTLRELSASLKQGRVRMHVVRVKEFSPMAKSMFEKPYRAGVLAKGFEQLLVLDTIKKRLERSHMLLVCLHCLKWSREVLVGETGDEVKCPVCGSKVIAALNPWDTDAVKLLEKWRRGGKLSEEELRVVRNAQKSAILVMSYGRKALLCLAGRGVGPTVAARILSLSRTEEDLLREIAKAEADYLRTREYWHDSQHLQPSPASNGRK